VIIVALSVAMLPRSLPLRGEPLAGYPDDAKLVFNEEGQLATVQVLEDPDEPAKRAILVDGYKIGWGSGFSDTTFYRKQVLLAHLPMILDTRIRHTLNVGLGSGVTLRTLGTYAEVQTLDCVEIDSAVVRASRLFPASSILDDPRVHLLIDDAVHYLLRSNREYDLIISDGKNHPFFSGNAALLCREFYTYARGRLSSDGLFVQWFPLSMLTSEFRISLRTLCDVFPYVETFFTPRDSVFVVSAKQPLAGRPGMTRQQFLGSQASRDLSPFFITEPAAVLARWTAGKEQLLPALGDGPVSTWDHQFLDFSSFKADPQDWDRAQYDNLTLLLRAEQVPRSGIGTIFDVRTTPHGKSAALIRRAFAEFFARRFGNAIALAEHAIRANPADPAARAVVELFRGEARKAQSRRGSGSP
jgi:hypothetical protein